MSKRKERPKNANGWQVRLRNLSFVTYFEFRILVKIFTLVVGIEGKFRYFLASLTIGWALLSGFIGSSRAHVCAPCHSTFMVSQHYCQLKNL